MARKVKNSMNLSRYPHPPQIIAISWKSYNAIWSYMQTIDTPLYSKERNESEEDSFDPKPPKKRENMKITSRAL